MSIFGQKTVPHRLTALIDGVFAIVITILVLDIKVPHETDILKNITVDHFLTGQFQDIMIYMVSFIMIGYIWVIQHNESHAVRFTNQVHIWITIVFLMFVALLPFSGALVNKFPGDRITELYFAGHMFIIGLISYINWAYLARNRDLIDPDITKEQITVEKNKLLVLPVVSLCAIGVAFLMPFVSSYILLLAPVIMSVMEWRLKFVYFTR